MSKFRKKWAKRDDFFFFLFWRGFHFGISPSLIVRHITSAIDLFAYWCFFPFFVSSFARLLFQSIYIILNCCTCERIDNNNKIKQTQGGQLTMRILRQKQHYLSSNEIGFLSLFLSFSSRNTLSVDVVLVFVGFNVHSIMTTTTALRFRYIYLYRLFFMCVGTTSQFFSFFVCYPTLHYSVQLRFFVTN